MRIICYVLILLFSFLEGASVSASQSSPIVTGIHVSLTAEGETRQCSYSDDESMTQILNYLCYLDPYHDADIDPDTFQANHWEVTVYYADGSATRYLQLHREYLQKDGGIWKQIAPEDDLLFLFS